VSFLRDYLSYSAGNEAPDLFHVWSAFATLSAAVSRRVWLNDGDTWLFCNIYVMLVGDAGCGKSTALKRAKRMLAEAGFNPPARSVETPEGLWRFMAGDPTTTPPTESPVAFPVKWPDGVIRECHPMTIMPNEFVNFISQNPGGWTSALNDIFDEDRYEYRTKNKGEDLLVGPYIVLLGALTTDISTDLQKARVIGTGFARRTIFQYGKRKFHEPHARQSFTSEQAEAKQRCIEHLRNLPKLHGMFKVSDDVWGWWNEWYDEHTKTIPQRSTPQTEGWLTSKPMQVQKVAMLTSLSERNDLVLEREHFELAIGYLAEMEKDLYHVLGGVGRNELANVAQKIYEYVSTLSEPIPKRTLKNHFFNSCKPPNDFDDCMRYLCDGEKLTEFSLQVGNTIDICVATPLQAKAFASAVAERAGRPIVAVPPELPQGTAGGVGP
jgi:hypothetical protein